MGIGPGVLGRSDGNLHWIGDMEYHLLLFRVCKLIGRSSFKPGTSMHSIFLCSFLVRQNKSETEPKPEASPR